MSTTQWTRPTVDVLRQHLLAETGSTMTASEVIRIWELSGVERLHLSNGASMIFKFAVTPFTTEADILINLAGHGIPVVAVKAWAVRDHTLGMLTEDLGVPLRLATENDAATAAVRLHAIPSLAYLDTFDEEALTSLPERGLAALAALQREGRFLNAKDIKRALQRLAPLARTRAVGAERPPFGVCHGEFHPTSLHVGTDGTRLLDVAKAFNGPGLLDLATWFGTRAPAKPQSLNRLIHAYIHVGAHPDAASCRGGLPADQWALGWHRIWAAHWFLAHAAARHHGRMTDDAHRSIIRRQLTGAVTLLTSS
ncbi:aminoglycoside phosphotransferase [Micromonospora sicca]|uniref:Aminoglycoside phosphotransferase n=1 Tax=Micromonospora sicca TaxID=2202420 RepID=A0A317DJE1_9ACTN|nr:phosphotransferase [Micromonospora sp. 4G51]PWR14859.1 aminoglycoside phosphotransferase [Micromonospora sp. 4G51]